MPHPSASWSFEEEDARRIDRLLRSFLKESGSRSACLVDRTGQLILFSGERPGFDSIAFASLAAADFSANDQLAAMIGEQEFASLFHQGEKESMYLVDVAKRFILIILFDERTTLGMIRIKVRRTVRELGRVFTELFDRVTSPRGLRSSEPTWADEAEEEIDRLFGTR
ncbi:MAG: hypothetical protein GEU90_07440 [Gemmatimonas sp.]|nr:hypothetical protein [Gemmatimonas sp.]